MNLKINLAIMLLLFFASTNSASADIFDWVKEKYQDVFTEKLITGKSIHPPYRVSTAREGNHLPVSIFLNLRTLLEDKNFTELNQLLDQYFQAFQNDVQQEEKLFTAYEAFQFDGDNYETLLKQWAAQFPENYQPYIARASYYYKLGWSARGSKWASETKNEQFVSMRDFFESARRDIATGLNLNNNILPAYSLLIGMEMAQKNGNKIDKYIEKAIAISPGSYETRSVYIQSLTPRWGGSYKKMLKFAELSSVDAFGNPKLVLLEGMILNDKGRTKAAKGAYNESIQIFSKALELGDNPTIHKRRGISYVFIEQYDNALKDFNRAIELYPVDPEYYYRRSLILFKLGRLDDAAIDINKALTLKPGYEKATKRKIYISSLYAKRAYSFRNEGENKKAFSAITQSLKLYDNYAYYHNFKARIYIDFNDLKMAEFETKKAIEIDPKEFSYFKLLDWILVKSKDYDQIISYWDKYIELAPKNSNAFNHRAWAKYLKGDYSEALKDSKISKDMGNQEGYKIYEKVKPLTES